MTAILHRGYKYRIYPDENQIEYFMQTFGCRLTQRVGNEPVEHRG